MWIAPIAYPCWKRRATSCCARAVLANRCGSRLENRFGVELMLTLPLDHGLRASLLYYFGVLTYAGRDPLGKLLLRVPSLVVQRLYVKQMREALLARLCAQRRTSGGVHTLLRHGRSATAVRFYRAAVFPGV